MAEVNQIIKNARDILVGKVPNPQSQIEQITIAIMYKLMDAKDKEAVDYGGIPSFFTGDYAEYSFSKIINTPNNIEKLTKYRTGLEKMGENLELPEMFRSVFKGAYLPYNDAAILALFMKEIDKIPTDNTEILGTAFEDLLSFMGSQGDAGQFRTPRHIIDMIVAIVEPQKDESILDPACGTAGFLVSAFNHIYEQNKNEVPGDTLTIDEKADLMKNINGYDITPEMVKLAKVNMYLHGFNEPKIIEYDTLSDKTNWKHKYDVIFANPPFMTPKGGIKPHELFIVKANRSEVLFVDYIIEHLNKNGRAGVIVPEGIVFKSDKAYKDLRKAMVEGNVLYAIISMPAGIFNPYAGVKTCILLFDKQIAKISDEILFVKMNNDGFDLGLTKKPILDNDIPAIINVVNEYQNSILNGRKCTDTIKSNPLVTIVTKETISKNNNILVGERYKESITHNSEHKIVMLGDVLKIERGASPRPINDFITNDGTGVNWIKIGDAKSESIYISSVKEKITTQGAEKSRAVKKGDLILSNSMSFGRPYILDIDGCVHDGWLILSDINNLFNKKYLCYTLGSQKVMQQFTSLATGGVVNNLNSALVKAVKIPLPPLPIQEQIVLEIEVKQAKIDSLKKEIDDLNQEIKDKIDEVWGE